MKTHNVLKKQITGDNLEIWTVANQKGGVGKTTSTVNLGGLLAEQGYSVLLIDLDPHTSLTSYLGIEADQLEFSIFDCMQNPHWKEKQLMNSVVMPTKTENLQVIGGSVAMATIDRQMNNLKGKGFLLTKTLSALKHKFDYVIIDCPPIMGILLINALAVCQRLIIPCQTEYLAIKGLQRMIETIHMVAKAGKNNFRYTIVPTMFDRRTRASILALRQLRDFYADALWNNIIPVDTKFRDASLEHLPLCKIDSETHGLRGYKILLRLLLSNQLTAKRAA